MRITLKSLEREVRQGSQRSIEAAAELADRVEAFLRDHGAHTQRERHADTDIRVLATLE